MRTRSDNPILNALLAIADEGWHPMSVSAERWATSPGVWRVTIELDDWLPWGEGSGELEQHAIKFDASNMPKGVLAAGMERAPSRRYTLGATEAQVETWVREVKEIGKAPDWARFNRKEEGRLCFLAKPIEWMKEPLRTVLLAKYGFAPSKEAI
jgi:hypothetical protein